MIFFLVMEIFIPVKTVFILKRCAYFMGCFLYVDSFNHVRLQYLHCLCTGDTAVLHKTSNVCLFSGSPIISLPANNTLANSCWLICHGRHPNMNMWLWPQKVCVTADRCSTPWAHLWDGSRSISETPYQERLSIWRLQERCVHLWRIPQQVARLLVHRLLLAHQHAHPWWLAPHRVSTTKVWILLLYRELRQDCPIVSITPWRR